MLFAGCPQKKSEEPNPALSSSAPNASSNSLESLGPTPIRVAELRKIEDTRALSSINTRDLTHPDPRIRRAAARALARAEQGRGRERLLSMLADQDSDVLAWSAYGLGEICAWDRQRTARRLITRAAALGVESSAPGGRLDPWFALARALGKCGNREAKVTLISWLSGPKSRSIAAAKGLGTIVTRNKRMAEETAAALLRAARGDAANAPFSEALYPFGRLKRAPIRVEEVLVDACRLRLGHNTPAQALVIRALATPNEQAVKVLASVLLADTGYTAAQRAEAARALGKIGTKEAQAKLLLAIQKLVPANDPVALTSLVGPEFGVLIAALAAIPASSRRIKSPGIDALLDLEQPKGAPDSVSRRIGLLKCAAARLVAGRNYQHAALRTCDPNDGSTGKLARLAAIDRGKLKGSRADAWKTYLDPKQPPVVREAALRLLASHPEVQALAPLVANALGEEHEGMVAEAATLVFSHPDRFTVDAKDNEKDRVRADPGIANALIAASKRKFSPDAIETIGVVARACGALRIESTKPWIESLCASPNPTLRTHAKRALFFFGVARPVCEAKDDNPYEPAPELDSLITNNQPIELDTDAGKLTIELHPDLAPVAATRIAQLVRKKFYDGMVIHRVVPGFVVQFGDPGGDGYGGSGDAALRCETSPVAFDTGVVGIALGGRDTGSSQLFVTLGPAPHLDGEYAVVGKASGPWDSVAEGDVIRAATLVD